MPQPALSAFVAHSVRTVARPAEPDTQLLARFIATQDEGAFAELVRRHGPFVLAVCRRTTGDHHEAEDAFQATFLVLARRAADVRSREGVRPFLYGVAVRVAKEARAVSARRRARESPEADVPDQPAELLDCPDVDVLRALDEEVAALPDHLRAAVVLCELDGLSRKETATRLGIPEGTLSSRLAKARKILAGRLRRRGVIFPAVGLGVLAGAAPVSARLSVATAALASPGAAVPAAVITLSTGVIRMLFVLKLRAALAAVVFGVVACAALTAAPAPIPPGDRPAPTSIPAPDLLTHPALLALKDERPVQPGPALATSPNKLLISRGGRLTLVDPNGENETELSIGPADRFPVASHVRLSRNGSTIAIITEVTEGEGLNAKRTRLPLHIRKVDEKEPGTDVGVQCQSFVWSPGGLELVCNNFKFEAKATVPVIEHFVVSLKTKKKTAVNLPNDHLVTDWSRDGTYFLTTALKGTPDRPRTQLFLMNMDGTQAKALSDEKEGAGFGCLSPDGTRVLCICLPPEKSEPKAVEKDKRPPAERPKAAIAVLTIATGKMEKLQGVDEKLTVQSYSWSPDGKKIAYTGYEAPQAKPGVVEAPPPGNPGVVNAEIESRLIVCDPDGKNQKTIISVKSKGLAGALTLRDWR